ncbi:MAG: hypothetical protein FP820_02485 [Sulfurimonas sp.]|nr:hypothetical protein [Sulfurimonas sp.]MBU3938058.1 hypothetical protein [bacterium]
MTSTFLTELIFKRITSLLFRLLVIGYAVFLLIVQHNFFDSWVYFILAIAYFIIHINLVVREYSILRMLNDYLFIFIILFYKDMGMFYNVLFLLFPIMNSPNHTQNNRRPFVLINIAAIVFILLNYTNNIDTNVNYQIYTVISLYIISLITFFEYYRNSYRLKLESIYTAIDKVTIRADRTSQLPKVYEKIQNTIKDKLNLEIVQITAFRQVRKKTIVKSSSQFVHTHNIDNVIKEINKTSVLLNASISLNNKENSTNICIKIENDIFVLLTKDKILEANIKQYITTHEVIIPILKRVANIIQLENSLDIQRNKVNSSLNKKYHYVNNIMEAIHYLSNEMSPIKGYFDLKKKYDNLDNDNLKKPLFLLLQKEETLAITCLDNVVNRTLNVLDKGLNPFTTKELKKTKYKQIFMLMQKIWINRLNETNTNFIVKNFDDNIDKVCYTDMNTLEFMFTDVYENVRKYSMNFKKVEFDFKNQLTIIVTNDIKDFKDKVQSLRTIVKNFNNDNKLEISRSSSFGLTHLKERASILNIKTTIDINEDEKYFIIKMKFMDKQNENTNN